MARRWLLTVLAGTAISFGTAATAGAQELDDPVTVDVEVATATVTADAEGQTLEAEVTTDAEVEELDTTVSPDAAVSASPDGPDAGTDGSLEVAGNELPVPLVSGPAESVPAGPATSPSQTAAGSGVTAAPTPSGATADDVSGGHRSRVITADRAARTGMWAETETFAFDGTGELAPEVAPPAETLPLVAAAAPTVATELSLPIIDTTPTVPALLRLLAGLLVVGAAATWQTVRNELA